MPSQIVPCYLAPDLDNAWSVAPGALQGMDGMAPLQSGAYGSIGTASLFAITSNDIIKGQLFRQVDGSVRLLVFRASNIDEYDSSGTRTNRGTGYNAITTNWEAAAWGNQIIACNYLDATQSSTGAGFSALGNGAPKARYIASNADFVMLADTDGTYTDNLGVTVLATHSDRVWWSGIQNPNTWNPSLSTQAGTERLAGAPGPIRQIVSFRGGFVAFKDNAIFLGQYVGPPPNGFIFQWSLISNRIGCITPDSVVELDGKLYFLHSSGFYEFDGQQLRNIGLPVFQNFLSTSGYLSGTIAAGDFSLTVSDGISLSQGVGDDIEGVYWIKVATRKSTANRSTMYGYNVRAGKWGRLQILTATSSTFYPGKFVIGNAADMQAFKTDSAGRFWMVWNDPSASALRSFRYPAASTDTLASCTLGLAGSPDGAWQPTKLYWRTLYPSTSPDTTMTVTVAGYSAERTGVPVSSSTGTVNSEFDEADIRANARYISASLQWTLGSTTVLAGIGWGTDGKPR